MFYLTPALANAWSRKLPDRPPHWSMDGGCDSRDSLFLIRLPHGRQRRPCTPCKRQGCVNDADSYMKNNSPACMRVDEVTSIIDQDRSSPWRVWYRDVLDRWHYIAPDFSSFFRLSVSYLGIYGWTLAYTDMGLSPCTKVCSRLSHGVPPKSCRRIGV